MDDITLNLLVLAVIVLFAGVIFLLVRQKQSRIEQEIFQIATIKGWKYEKLREPLAWGTRLTSPHWTLEAVSRSSGREVGPGSSDVSMQTTWTATVPGSTLLIGERRSQADLGRFGDMLVSQIFELALGEDAHGLQEVPVGSDDFRQKYMVWAQDLDQVRISSTLESMLVNWKGKKPLIKRTSEGITIELRGVHLSKPSEFIALVQLGEMFI